MTDPISGIKVGTAMAAPTGRAVRKLLRDRQRRDCMAGFLRTAISAALADSSPAIRNAVPEKNIGAIANMAIDRAREDANGTAWYKLPQRIIGKARQNTPDLSLRTSATIKRFPTTGFLGVMERKEASPKLVGLVANPSIHHHWHGLRMEIMALAGQAADWRAYVHCICNIARWHGLICR